MRDVVQASKPIVRPMNILNKTKTEQLYNSDAWNNETLIPFNSECPFVLGQNSTVNPAFDHVTCLKV